MYIYETIALSIQNSPLTWNQFHNYNIRVGNNHDLPQHRLKTLSTRHLIQTLQVASTRIGKHFLHSKMHTEPQRRSCSKPILFPGRIRGTAQCPYLIQTRYIELTDLITDSPSRKKNNNSHFSTIVVKKRM